MKVPNLSPLKLFAPASPRPVLVPAGAGGNMMFARGQDDDGYDYDDVDPGPDMDQPTSRSRRVVREPSTRTRSTGGDGGGRQRSIQFQPEERYWTDYLRIALPIIGLLLMVGLFWYWVQMLIDDPASPTEPEPTVTTQGQPALAASGSTPAPTEPPVSGGQAPARGATPPPAAEAPADEAAADETEPADAVTDDQLFAPDDTARINEPDVNMRAEPTIGEAGVINATLEADTVVTIRSGPEEADGLQWWEIVVEDTGETGWVAQDYLEPVE